MHRAFFIVGFLTVIILAAVAGYAFGKGFRATGDLPIALMALTAASSAFAYFLAIAVHETGHAAIGSRVGLNVIWFVVGPFMWQKQLGVWRFKWNRSLTLAGGLVVCLPGESDDTQSLIQKYKAMVVAGPIASLLLALLTVVLVIAINGLMTSNLLALTVLRNFCVLVAAFSLAIFVVTIIPSHVGGFFSDGARYLRFTRGGDSARMEVASIKLLSISTSRMRPRLIDVEQLKEMKELAMRLNEPFAVYVDSYLYRSALDRGDIDAAEIHLSSYLGQIEKIPKGMRSNVWIDAAYYYAWARKDLVKAKEYWGKIQSNPAIEEAEIHATQAAIAKLEGDYKLALENIEQAIRKAPLMISPGSATMLLEQMQSLRESLA